MINYHSDSSISVHKWKDLQKVLSCSQSSASSRLSPAGRTRYSGDSVLELSCRHNMAPENAELLYSVYNDMRTEPPYRSMSISSTMTWPLPCTALHTSCTSLNLCGWAGSKSAKPWKFGDHLNPLSRSFNPWLQISSTMFMATSMQKEIRISQAVVLGASPFMSRCALAAQWLGITFWSKESIGHHFIHTYITLHYITFTLHLHYITYIHIYNVYIYIILNIMYVYIYIRI